MITSVPNVSEGRDPDTLAAFAAAVQAHGHLLDSDPRADANRTVLGVIVERAPHALGLDHLRPFPFTQKILEERLAAVGPPPFLGEDT